jgi:hypothetical protein
MSEATMIDMKNPVIDLSMERCDGCGARAVAAASKEGFSDVMFCFHHIKDNREELLDVGWTVTDDGAMYEALGLKID